MSRTQPLQVAVTRPHAACGPRSLPRTEATGVLTEHLALSGTYTGMWAGTGGMTLCSQCQGTSTSLRGRVAGSHAGLLSTVLWNGRGVSVAHRHPASRCPQWLRLVAPGMAPAQLHALADTRCCLSLGTFQTFGSFFYSVANILFTHFTSVFSDTCFAPISFHSLEYLSTLVIAALGK